MKKIYCLVFILLTTAIILYCRPILASTKDDYDLAVSEIIINPPSPTVNHLASITVKIKNNGKYPAVVGTGFNSTYYNFQDFEKSKTVYPSINSENPVAPGATVDFYYEGEFKQIGDKDIFFEIDHSNTLEEKDENNNIAHKKFKAINYSDLDLAVSSLSIDKANPTVDEKIKITASVINLSDVSLTASSGLMFENDFSSEPLIFKDIFYDFLDFKLDKFSYDPYPTFKKPLNKDNIIKYYYEGFFTKAGEKKLSFTANNLFFLSEINKLNNSTTTSVFVYSTSTDRDDFAATQPTVSLVSSTSVLVSWETSRETVGQVEYKLNYYINYTGKETDKATKSHQIIIKNLAPNTLYKFKINSNYQTINKASEESTFQTPANDNFQVVIVEAKKTSNNQALFSWQTNLASKARLFYKKTSDKDFSYVDETSSKSKHELILDKLELLKYDYYLSITSLANNKIETSKAILDMQEVLATAKKDEIINKTSDMPINVLDNKIYSKWAGKVIKSKDSFYYIGWKKKLAYNLNSAVQVGTLFKNELIGLNNVDIDKIQVGFYEYDKIDTDKDGLSDKFEDAIGTNKTKFDTDNDGFNDKIEIENGFSPVKKNTKKVIDEKLTKKLIGKILIQPQNKGRLWYVSPLTKKRYYLKNAVSGAILMKSIAQSINDSDYALLIKK